MGVIGRKKKMMMNGDEARKFGEKSLADVQVTDLNSVRSCYHYNEKKCNPT